MSKLSAILTAAALALALVGAVLDATDSPPQTSVEAQGRYAL